MDSCFFLDLFGLDRQRDRAILAIDIGELGFDLFTDLDHHARVLNAAARQLGCAQRADDAVAEIDKCAPRIDFGDFALDDRVLWMLCEPG